MSSVAIPAAAPPPRARRLKGPAPWVAMGLFVAFCIAMRTEWPWLLTFPKAWAPPLASWIGAGADGVIGVVQPVTRGVAALIDTPMRALAAVLAWLPWPAVVALAVALALVASGRRLALFALTVCAYVLVTGYWRQSLNTLVLVSLAVPLSILPGFGFGVLAHRIPASRRAIEVALDLMQTIPAFAYLIPLLLLFGFGPATGLIASAVFALPPMVRNTWAGLARVPEAVREAGTMSGCTPAQRFWQVELPSALPQLMVGINQSTLAALSMVIIATIIGGFEDIGWEVLNATRMAQLGQCMLAGFVIVLMAILIDRVIRGFTARASRAGRNTIPAPDRLLLVGCAVVAAASLALRVAMPDAALLAFGLHEFIPVGAVNAALLDLVRHHGPALQAVKNDLLVFFLLPLRIGLAQAVTPTYWGFGLTPTLVAGYAATVVLLGGLAAKAWGWRAGAALVAFGLLLFYGVAGLPWPAVIAAVGLLGWRAGGWRVALLAAGGLAFILLADLWGPLTFSLYLCTMAVLVAVTVGGLIGVWAASSNRVSALVSPVNDALQTIPQFVFLIPAVMFFKVGDVTALMAVVLYAVVPPIRYVELGLRGVRPEIVEAARQVGCTPMQLFWQVRLPLARPVILLGINQTIMAALSMLAIAAMVGTRDLGQQVYVALGKADTGLGLLAGSSIALIAIISDRIIRASIGGGARASS